MALVNRDPTFWDVRVVERRLRRGELTEKQLIAHVEALPDACEKFVQSTPLEEPIERPPPRRPMVRVTAVPSDDDEFGGDDMDDDLIDDEDDEVEDE
ncbi:MAG TPA: hypothetical protein PKE31_16575 [Pseudomonadota bacterium]|jgi:hypothetical protein|nr:hypothetical protein [Pseudomonadota bacterium]